MSESMSQEEVKQYANEKEAARITAECQANLVKYGICAPTKFILSRRSFDADIAELRRRVR